ncbi:wax ester/triacylglycerol synthase domain-containing protein [Rhodococcus sp. NPDC058505]|uniref:wax ester/triacylglycerol synthase domain-containing protein n=1 Tax=Rhodococcus sp. NPDC058505 TaxID=3346531 RepID=UPI0036548776
MTDDPTSYRGELPFLDFAYLYADSDRTPQAIVNAYLLGRAAPGHPEITSEDVTAWVAARISSSPMFTTRVVRAPGDIAPPRWSPDSSFDISNHVFVQDFSGEADLNDALARVAEQRMNPDRPLWEVRLLRGVADRGTICDVVVIKVHHSAADGIASANLGRMLLTEGVPSAAPQDGTARHRSFMHAACTLPGQLSRYVAALRRLRVLQHELARETAEGRIVMPEQLRPRTRFNARVGRHRTVGSVRFSLAQARSVRSRMPAATVNDVILAAVSGALTAYLDDGGVPAALATLVPKDVRDLGELDAINQALPMIVDLHSAVGEPQLRLAAIHESVRRERTRREHPVIMESVHCVAATPPVVARINAWREKRGAPSPGAPVHRANTVVSNYMRETGPLALAGHPVVEIRCVPLVDDNIGLAHMVASVDDALTVTFTADSAMMPDPGRYAALLRASFEDLVHPQREDAWADGEQVAVDQSAP